jgi:hypothetical protein
MHRYGLCDEHCSEGFQCIIKPKRIRVCIIGKARDTKELVPRGGASTPGDAG